VSSFLSSCYHLAQCKKIQEQKTRKPIENCRRDPSLFVSSPFVDSVVDVDDFPEGSVFDSLVVVKGGGGVFPEVELV